MEKRAIPHLNAVVLAGGSGQRFWPLSRELRPKQLLSLFGRDSLVVQALRRIGPFIDGETGGLEIVTGEQIAGELRSHLASCDDLDLPAVRVLVEPSGRNTAPAIALAAAELVRRDPEALMIVLPSDHLLEAGDVWADAVSAGARLAADGRLVTIGIRPDRAEIGYGYIKIGAPLEGLGVGSASPHVAERFVEKPDRETAEAFVASGEYLWNAGIFVFGAETLLQELESAGTEGREIVAAARAVAELPPEDWTTGAAREAFAEAPSAAIDKALMERSDKVATIPSELRWDDVGSLLALERVSEADERGNVLAGRAVEVDSRDSVVYSTGRLVAALGVVDMLVVDTEDATLVCPKERAQDVRSVVERLREQGASEVVESRTGPRPWGSWTVLLEADGFKIKRIEVAPGRRLSLQRHAHRSEHWVVVQGHALVTRGEEQLEVRLNESTFIPAGTVHRLENPGDEALVIVEVQVGDYVGEDDIERLSDDWER